MDKTLYIIADPHLGSIDGDIDLMIRFIRSLDASRSTLLFLGDLFHVWVGIPRYHTPEIKRLLKELDKYRSEGGVSLLVGGNRDTLLPNIPEGGKKLAPEAGRDYLRWIKTRHRDDIRLIPVEEIDYFKANDKYTLVMTKDGEFLIRKGIKELVNELDPARFWQIHCSTIVNVSRIDKVSHSLTGRGVIKLKDRTELLTVSRNYLHLFKHM
jgi:DNA-binding LytR/AlgR family response regulator